MIAPCRDCDRKGCGAYHDKCKVYQAWLCTQGEKKEQDKAKKSLERVLNKGHKR